MQKIIKVRKNLTK